MLRAPFYFYFGHLRHSFFPLGSRCHPLRVWHRDGSAAPPAARRGDVWLADGFSPIFGHKQSACRCPTRRAAPHGTRGAYRGQPRARCQQCHSSGAEQCEPPTLNIRSGVIPWFCAQMGCTQSQNYSSPTARRPSGVHADPWQTMWVFTTLPALTSALHPSQKLLPASRGIGELQERQRAAAPQQRAPAVNHQ